MSGPLVSILVHNLNRADATELCLRSLQTISYRPLEVVVLDAGSADGSVDRIGAALLDLHEAGIDARLIECAAMGVSASRNLAARYATGELLFFLDNDGTVTDTSDLAGIVARFGDEPKLAVVGFKILMADADEIDPLGWVYRRNPSTWSDRSFATFTFAGTAFCARASYFTEEGGFWERLRYAREEEELCLALVGQGLEISYDPAVTLRHFPKHRSKAEISKRRAIEMVNGILVLWRRLPAWCAVPAIGGRVGTMTLKSIIRDVRSLPGILKSVAQAGGELWANPVERKPIGNAAAWHYLLLHLRDGTREEGRR